MQRKYNLTIERGAFPEKLKNFTVTAKLPPSVDLRPRIRIMYDQGELGSCTANALCYSFINNDVTYQPSRLFLYYNTRVLDNSVEEDDGSTLSQGINALRKFGVCSEQLWPYDITKFRNKPPTPAFTEGLNHQVISSARVVQTMASLKGCLFSGQPFVVGILVFSSFESQIVTRTGNVPMPNTSRERILGGHAVVCVGYNDARKVWIMKNSWGSGWGDKGHFYLPYAYLLNSRLSGDIWKITNVEVVIQHNKKLVNLKVSENIKHLKQYSKYY
jgi:C1A family cysteine protease